MTVRVNEGVAQARGKVNGGLRALALRLLPAPAHALLGLAAWQALCVTVYRRQGYLPPAPLDVVRAAVDNAALPAGATWTTLREAVSGYLLAALGGMARRGHEPGAAAGALPVSVRRATADGARGGGGAADRAVERLQRTLRHHRGAGHGAVPDSRCSPP